MNLSPVIHWVKEREAIRVRKDRGDAFPWTEDEILRTYRFCNVRREDDRVTKWIDHHIRQPFAAHPYLWFMLCTARQINWPWSLHMLIGDLTAEHKNRLYPHAWPDAPEFMPEAMQAGLEDMASMNQKVFTGAYIITAPSTKGAKKTEYVARVTLGALWKDRARFERHFANSPTLRSTHQLLMKFDGWGPFLSYQAIVDMRFTNILGSSPDIHSFVAAGPGTIRGLNRINGRPLDYALSQHDAMRECLEIYKTIQDDTGVAMDLSDVPNILCETDKYLRVKNGEGKPRALYVQGRGA